MLAICAATVLLVASCDSREVRRDYHDNGQLAFQGELVNGVPEGTWEEWYPSGAIFARTTFVAGAEHGVRKHWFEEGAVAGSGQMEMGQRHGEWVLYYPSGQPKARAFYEHGLESGIRTTWYESGANESEAQVHAGLQNGPRTFWYESGGPRAKATFLNDQKQGLEIELAESGSWVRSVCYVADEPVRRWEAAAGEARPPSEPDPCALEAPDASSAE